MNILEIKNLTKRFSGLTAVSGASCAVQKNSITALIGPNGAGKTTLFDLITGLIRPDYGTIIFKGTNVSSLSAFRRARLGIARTFQAIRIFPALSALDNVMIALPDHEDELLSIFRSQKKLRHALHERAQEFLRLVNLHEKARHQAGSLSYGQQKLLEIARAVATGAELLLLDEPAAGVNRTLLQNIITLIQKLHREGKTIFIVEHDMGFVMKLSQRIIVMDYGKEIAEGTPREIQNNAKVLEAYLGLKATDD